MRNTHRPRPCLSLPVSLLAQAQCGVGMMAAAVLAEGSVVSGFSGIIHNGNGAAVAGGVPGVGPAAWNRSLERALEEASVTGVLNLSGRKLREFPRSAARQDLSDTTQADLSRNRLSEVPAEICHYISLESLNLYQNCIRYVPEATLNLQALSFLNISRNQLTSLPGYLCSLPLKVLIASNNKLDCLPEEVGGLRHLTELDVSCNEIRTIPTQIGKLESLRDLNIRRNHLMQLPEELAELPLVRLDFSCNKVTRIPVCYRNLRHLQTITLENNPLQCPPAQICIKGKIHIFKYLNIEACKSAPDLPDYERRAHAFSTCHDEVYPGRPYGALDSGFNSVDSGDKRWSGNEPTDEFSDISLRSSDSCKDQRLRKEPQPQEHKANLLITNGGVEHDLDQIDYIDSYATEEEEDDVRHSKGNSLSSQFMAYIEERRVSHEVPSAKQTPNRGYQKSEDGRRHLSRDSEELRRPESLSLPQNKERQTSPRRLAERPALDATYLLSMANSPSQADTERKRDILESARREAQLAAQQYEAERRRGRLVHNDSLSKNNMLSPEKQNPQGNECPLPSRRSQHTDDSALLVNGFEPQFFFEVDNNTNTIKRRPGNHMQCDERSPVSPASSTPQTTHLSSPANSYRHSPESFLFRAAVRDEIKRGNTPPPSAARNESVNSRTEQSSKFNREDVEVTERLRKNIESRLKVSLPDDLGSALTDGVVLCHLANHVRPRSVPSIHVPSPAVPKLTMAKCRRNVENFLEACRKIGVPQDRLCLPPHILEETGLVEVAGTVQALLDLAPPKHLSPTTV
ncbi:LOW QUALITY PROTEIN: DISP complex protein LRCH3 [Spea bombifrons]|uniref:LOW QUALITY PROTEIN: DISP complex protein LRCH3 n=1 Tax=Spea bombifrons TaxID=233779 RepID=UPI00234B90B5|nr:LOW QUALITY PROTEIN: DISP complex protein LRCH3 [Spea bombifrons]